MVDLLGNDDIDRLLAIGKQQRADLLGLAPDRAQADDSREVTNPDEAAVPAEAQGDDLRVAETRQ
jgi:hypothetical protein